MSMIPHQMLLGLFTLLFRSASTLPTEDKHGTNKRTTLHISSNMATIEYGDDDFYIKNISSLDQLNTAIKKLKTKEFRNLKSLSFENISNVASIQTGSLKDFTKLEELSFKNTSLEEFPEDICLLPNIKRISFTRSQIREIPDKIEKLSRLEILSISENRRLKRLPNSIGDLKNLKKLIAIDCSLEFIPSSIKKLEDSLEYIDFSKNCLISGSYKEDKYGQENLKEIFKIKAKLDDQKKPEISEYHEYILSQLKNENQKLMDLNKALEKDKKELSETVEQLTKEASSIDEKKETASIIKNEETPSMDENEEPPVAQNEELAVENEGMLTRIFGNIRNFFGLIF